MYNIKNGQTVVLCFFTVTEGLYHPGRLGCLFTSLYPLLHFWPSYRVACIYHQQFKSKKVDNIMLLSLWFSSWLYWMSYRFTIYLNLVICSHSTTIERLYPCTITINHIPASCPKTCRACVSCVWYETEPGEGGAFACAVVCDHPPSSLSPLLS